jgi:hypothetical protein
MRYREIKENAADETIQRDTPEDPNHVAKDLDDGNRKPSLTLRMINRLKKMRAAKKLEMAKKKDVLGAIYGQAGDEDSL